ncbi:MAG: hypothetical protein ABI919_10865 [Ramlibacter sp.]
MLKSSAILLASCCFVAVAQAQGFSFSGEEAKERNAEAAENNQRDAYVQYELATPCRKAIRNQKILVLVGENTHGTVSAKQGAFGEHVDAINKRLQSLGLRTFSPAQIRQQVAQAEIDAYFRNDPDAALSAARKMAAQYTLRGVIASRAERNPMINVNQVSVRMDFTLTDASGKPVATANATNQSYAGSDTSGMALTLIDERADEVVAKLYGDYCRNSRVR